MSEEEAYYISVGLTNVSGVSGVMTAPSGSMYYKNHQLYIALDGEWAKIGSKPKSHKATNLLPTNAIFSWQPVVLNNTIFTSPTLSSVLPGIQVTRGGRYRVRAAVGIYSVDLKIQTSTGQSSLESRDRSVEDTFILEPNERIDLMIRRRGNKDILIDSSQIQMIVETR